LYLKIDTSLVFLASAKPILCNLTVSNTSNAANTPPIISNPAIYQKLLICFLITTAIIAIAGLTNPVPPNICAVVIATTTAEEIVTAKNDFFFHLVFKPNLSSLLTNIANNIAATKINEPINSPKAICQSQNLSMCTPCFV
jgi:hypothetical protein